MSLTETMIRGMATAQSFERGENYYHSGAILGLSKRGNTFMDPGKSQRYHHAIRWLEKARRAYLGSGQEDEWSAYLEGLIRVHARKYSLRPQLEALRV